MDETRIDKAVYGKTRQQACEHVALDFMERNKSCIFNHIRKVLVRERAIQGSLINMYMAGHKDGFAMALELILSGALDLQEINKNNPEPDQARERAVE